jgi:integrase
MAQVRNRGSNVYQIVIFFSKYEKPYYETFYGTKAQAKIYANTKEGELKAKRKKINIASSQSITVRELFDMFLEAKLDAVNKKKMEMGTYVKYKTHLTKLKDVIGCYYAEIVEQELIEEELEFLYELNYSDRNIKNYYDTLRTCVNWGIAKRKISNNFMLGIESPEIGYKKRDVLNPEELKKFIEVAKGYKHYLPVKVIAITGMRVGEVMALKWENILFDEKCIKIIEAINTKYENLKEPKTINGKRILELDDETIEELKQHKQIMLAQNKANDDDFIFQSDHEEFLHYRAINRTKNRVLKKAGLKHIRNHDLRHGMGSIMLDKGCSVTQVAETLGDVPATIMKNYAHALRRGKSIINIIG